MRLTYLVSLLLASISNTSAQVDLELEQAIVLAQRNSPLARQIKATYQAERWRFRAAQAALKPQLLLDGAAPGFARQIGQVLQPDGSFLFRNYSRSTSAVTLGLSQSVLATGGTISLTTGLSRIDVFGVNRTLFWASTPFALVFNQPLFRINQPRWEWQQQQLTYRQSTRQQVEALEELAVTVTGRFFAVGLARVQLRNAEYNQAINDTLVQIAKTRYELGRIAESDWLQVELSLLNARNAAEQFKAQLRIATRELSALLGVAGEVNVRLETLVIPPTLNPDPEMALAQARANRSDVLAFELTQNQAQLSLRSAQTARQFNADLTAVVGYNQSAGTLDQAYQRLQAAQSISINFKVPLYTAGRNRALVEAARSDLEAARAQIQAAQNTFDLDVFNQVNTLTQLKNSLRLVALADTIAQKRFQFLRDRYQIGKTDITTLTFAQLEKDNALVNYLQTLSNYWTAYYRLRRLTLYDFIKEQRLALEVE